MPFAPYENTVGTVDDWTLSYDQIPADTPDGKKNALARLAKHWEKVKGDVDGQAGLKMVKPDFDALLTAMIKAKSHAITFDLVLTKTEFCLNVEAGNTTVKVGSVKVPTELEDYRNFLGNLNGWSQGDHNLVPDGDFKNFNAKNPPPPPKPPKYKSYDELAKKNVKSELEAFRTWAKTNSAGKKAVEALDKTAKAKPTDAPRVQALKDANIAYTAYLKTI